MRRNRRKVMENLQAGDPDGIGAITALVRESFPSMSIDDVEAVLLGDGGPDERWLINASAREIADYVIRIKRVSGIIAGENLPMEDAAAMNEAGRWGDWIPALEGVSLSRLELNAAYRLSLPEEE
jgi:hypothetical protein